MENNNYLKRVYTQYRKRDILSFLNNLQQKGLDNGAFDTTDNYGNMTREQLVLKYPSLFLNNKQLLKTYTIYAKRLKQEGAQPKKQQKEEAISINYDSDCDEAREARLELEEYDKEFSRKTNNINSYKQKIDMMNVMLDKKKKECETIKNIIDNTVPIYEKEKKQFAESKAEFLLKRNKMECRYIELKYNKKPKVDVE